MGFYIILITCTLALVDGKQNFFNCSGNDHNSLTRRCCKSDDLPYGCECFDISSKSYFRNSVFALPECPDKIPVTFTFYSRQHNDGVTLTATDLLNGDVDKFKDADNNKNKVGSATIGSASSKTAAKPPKKTHFLVHGFNGNGNRNWMKAMRMSLLMTRDVQVVTVDWSRGAGFPYHQAVANTRTTAALIARHVTLMADTGLAEIDHVHLIGHSLGAHVMGLAGQEVQRMTNGKKLARISGLDPAGPLFLTAKNIVILDKTDATFVDIIHTNGNVQGMMRPTAHADFYPNGGQSQAGCPLVDVTTCSHSRCHEMYLSSVLGFCSYEAANVQGEVCEMGINANSTCSGVYKNRSFKTIPVFPYCYEH